MKESKTIFCITLLMSFIYISGCDNGSIKSNPSYTSGEKLANIHCIKCHAFSNPELLDKSTWKEHVLPRMGNFLGYYSQAYSRETILKESDFDIEFLYPENPVISTEEWEAIKQFYIDSAPDTLINPQSEKKELKDLELFDVILPKQRFNPPSTTFVSLDLLGRTSYADAHSNSLILLDDNLDVWRSAKIDEAIVGVDTQDGSLWITSMGSFSPTDGTPGSITKLPLDGTRSIEKPITELRRPAHSHYLDYNNDGITDVVVSEFGKWLGRLSIHYGSTNGEYMSAIVYNQTGAISSYPFDYNGDNYMDIISLFGQGNEGIYIHINNEGKTFETKKLVELSPSHGSSSFVLSDYNSDGYIDIVYTAGDNADFPPILKPYHGIYLFTNDGKNKFEQEAFLPLHGAYKASANDFDNDGDIDLAAISFFPSFKKGTAKSFVYYENENGLYIERKLGLSKLGRWIVMDASDYDKDGDLDLILGSLAFEVVGNNNIMKNWLDYGFPYIILENKTI